MKLKPDHKAAFLMIGLIFAWVALYIMLADFYEGLVEVTVSAVEGGAYHPYYLRAEELQEWLVCMVISSVCLAIGLRAEETTKSL